ncbi:hypothetical protein NIIDMKKI_57600 [Mycobacterium kansasii]|uniref:J domain-containing protein n=1 Tax=Mycobacterium kansasii TaxID=1768 RepID=A0A7G1IJF3_MYCKA|nr:hypothetical protein NIIDMKKI_57600 [Mycobacterium kansasii]
MRSGEPDSGADERLRQVLAAYRVLRDPQLRDDYDRAVARVRKHRPSARIAVRRNDSVHVGATLWAGPVRWHR